MEIQRRNEAAAVQRHGGNRYNRDIVLDFSVNTNPLGLPSYIGNVLEKAAGNTALWEWYPDPDCSELRRALSVCHGVPQEQIVCGNGASELLFAGVRAALASGKKESGSASPPLCLLPVPSFSEYERALLAAGANICYERLDETDDFAITEKILDRLTQETSLLFLCSPGNPTGRLIAPGLLQQILMRCRQNKIRVILDTCFLELAAGAYGREAYGVAYGPGGADSFERTLLRADPDLIILKAFTKLYAMAGLRLGYCLCGDRDMAERMRIQLPCWNVSGMAQLAGLTALDAEKSDDYISQSRELISAQRKWLESGLIHMGFHTIPGQANFICFYSDKSLYLPLLKRGILIRDCSSFRGLGQGWYRAAVRTQKENERLLRELGSI